MFTLEAAQQATHLRPTTAPGQPSTTWAMHYHVVFYLAVENIPWPLHTATCKLSNPRARLHHCRTPTSTEKSAPIEVHAAVLAHNCKLASHYTSTSQQPVISAPPVVRASGQAVSISITHNKGLPTRSATSSSASRTAGRYTAAGMATSGKLKTGVDHAEKSAPTLSASSSSAQGQAGGRNRCGKIW